MSLLVTAKQQSIA